ncbi:MAG: hypothetical protein OXF28_02340 [Thaumarchaeota archaeon]|nr:hypothetical protein [Nitrososphaerota archaeon]MCY3975956.1 hypothetical protein [Nitrososphaerota archaeon]
MNNEISVPKEIRQIMLSDAQETFLGTKKGAIKQYRYGNLHIREYDEFFLVHVDKKDPRKDPIGHLIFDATEVLSGLLFSFIGNKLTGAILKKNKGKHNLFQFLSSLIFGYVGYNLTKKLR